MYYVFFYSITVLSSADKSVQNSSRKNRRRNSNNKNKRNITASNRLHYLSSPLSFKAHLSESEMKSQVDKGELFTGVLRVNGKQQQLAFVTAEVCRIYLYIYLCICVYLYVCLSVSISISLCLSVSLSSVTSKHTLS